jgi:glutamine amidotransferase
VIALVDYGAGNLASVRKGLAAVGAEVVTPSSPAELARASGIVVPGVGHFGATRALDESWRRAIRDAVARGTALLGICLGMQWLFEGSSEAPAVPGLGLLSGTCTRLGASEDRGAPRAAASARAGLDDAACADGVHSAVRLKVPHVGWNSLELPRPTRLMHGVAPGAQVYFTHSYAAPVGADTAAVTTYGGRFAAAVERGRVAGVQFHPEKSGDIGLRILANWMALCLSPDRADA